MFRKPVLLDTDIGTDVDDCLALALILRCPELALAAVTTVYGDVQLRARMALKLLALAGAGDVPVAAGAGEPLPGAPPVYWAGHEGEGLLEPGDAARKVDTHAVDLIVRTAAAHPGELTLVAIGPLTNVAWAFRREPALPRLLAGVVVMGGVVGGASSLHLPWVEHNFRCDPAAAAEVLASGARLTLVPLDVTMQVRMTPEDVARVRCAGDPLRTAVAGQVDRYPRYRQQGWTYLHDPLAVAALVAPDLVACREVYAVVETAGRHTAGELLVRLPEPGAAATARVALEVEAARAREFIVSRLSL